MPCGSARVRPRRPADRVGAARRRRSSRPTASRRGCSTRRRPRATSDRRRWPAVRHRLEYLLVQALHRGRARDAGRRSCARCGALLGLAFYTFDRAHRRIARAQPRGGVSRPRPAAERRAIVRGGVRALRPAAVRAAEVQHAVAARRCWRASSSKARSASRAGVRAGQGRAVRHRALRLLGAAGDGARAAARSRSACWRARSTTRALNDSARADPHADRQHA